MGGQGDNPHGGGDPPKFCDKCDPRGLYRGAPEPKKRDDPPDDSGPLLPAKHKADENEDGSSSSKKGKKKESPASVNPSSSSTRTQPPKPVTTYDNSKSNQAGKTNPPKAPTQYDASSSKPSVSSSKVPITRYDTASSSKVPVTIYDSKSQAPKSKIPPSITKYFSSSSSKAPKAVTQYDASSSSKAPASKPVTQYDTSSSKGQASKPVTQYDTSSSKVQATKSKATAVLKQSTSSSKAPKAITTYDTKSQAPKTQAPKTQVSKTASSSKKAPTIQPPPSMPKSKAPPHVQSIFTSQADVKMASRQTKYEQLSQTERKVQEDWALGLIKRAGVCPSGFGWRRLGNGYQCHGGSHYMKDEYLAEGKAALDSLRCLEASLGTSEQYGPYYPSHENSLLYEYHGPQPMPELAFRWMPILMNNLTEFWWKGKKCSVYDPEFVLAQLDAQEKDSQDLQRVTRALISAQYGQGMPLGYRGVNFPQNSSSGMLGPGGNIYGNQQSSSRSGRRRLGEK